MKKLVEFENVEREEQKIFEKEISDVKLNSGKVFTNYDSNIIMKKSYNPLKVNCKIYEREGLPMKYEVLDVVKKLNEKYNKKHSLLLKMIEECEELEYDIVSAEKIIDEFYFLE